jgi:NADP-dependent 3-hydroxy acid dehydrogenase YdfG
MSNNTQVWFTTSCSTGFGHALANKVLAAGNKAVITARKISNIKDFERNFKPQCRSFGLGRNFN